MPARLNGALIRQLKIFVSVVDNGGFSAAQAELNTSAATISVQIKELEYQLGMVLCRRGRMGFKLTERGQTVYDVTKVFFSAFDKFNLSISNIRHELVGDIHIGMQDNVAANPNCRVPAALSRFNERKNDVIFHLEKSIASEQESRTLEGRYNLAIGTFIHRIPGLVYKKLFDEKMALFCAKGHPLFNKPANKITLDDLNRAKLISTGPLYRILTQTRYLSQQPTAIAENMDSCALLLLSGQYIGFLPVEYAAHWVQRGLMKSLLAKKMAGTVDFHMITKKGEQQPYVVDVFIQDLIAVHALK